MTKARLVDFWVWDPAVGGYRPHSTEWWDWDADDGVLRPRPVDGWRWDPLARHGTGDWILVDIADCQDVD